VLGLTIEKSILTSFLGALICGSVAFAAPKSSGDPAQDGAGDFTRTPNRYVEIKGVRYAYRTLGRSNNRTPLVLLQHFTGTMDDWDQALIEGLAKSRQVYVFDQAGVGASGGTTPDTIAPMAKTAEDIIDALQLKEVDLLGFSMGGFIAQQIAVEHPGQVRKVILVGTGPQGGEGIKNLPTLLADATKISKEKNVPLKVVLFYSTSEEGEAAGLQAMKRIHNHSVDPEPTILNDSMQAQAKSIVVWGSSPSNLHDLSAVKAPVLVVNGSKDIMVPTTNSYALFQAFPAAQLSLYPDSGHGSLFQYHDLFISQVNTFLDGVSN
jgi:pimeloyl-ACP methyl ester carboxylesterase